MYLNNRVSLKIISQIVLLFSCMIFSTLSSAQNVKTEGENTYQSVYGEGYTTDGRYFSISGSNSFGSDPWGTYEYRYVYFYLDGLGYFYQDVSASELVFDKTRTTVTINAVVGGYPVSVTFTGDKKYTRSRSKSFDHGTEYRYQVNSTSITNDDMTMTGTLADTTIDVTSYGYFTEYRSSWKLIQK